MRSEDAGNLLNYSEIAKDADVSANTVKNWISILSASGILFLLEPWHRNVTKRMIKAPKLYFWDTGLCAWLSNWNSPEALESGAMSGAFLENWVISEIIREWKYAGETVEFYYYRDKDQKEIDLLLFRNGMYHPIEIKKTAKPDKKHTASFNLPSQSDTKRGEGAMICMIEDSFPLSELDMAIPVGWV